MVRNSKIAGVGLALTLVLGISPGWAAQEAPGQSVRVSFSEPSSPGRVEIKLRMGSITVRTHSESDVVFEIPDKFQISAPSTVDAPKPRSVIRAEESQRDEPSSEGMFVIQNKALYFEITERDNVMKFESNSWRRVAVSGARDRARKLSLTVLVPANTSLKLATINGRVSVDGVNGELELKSVNGRIEATNVSGSVVANTVNGHVTVTLDEIAPDRFMAFSSHKGTIEVTFPPDAKADLHLDSVRGAIYSDFEIDIDRSSITVREDLGEGTTRIKAERKIRGKLNGGGPEMRFKTYKGSIYIRSSAVKR